MFRLTYKTQTIFLAQLLLTVLLHDLLMLLVLNVLHRHQNRQLVLLASRTYLQYNTHRTEQQHTHTD